MRGAYLDRRPHDGTDDIGKPPHDWAPLSGEEAKEGAAKVERAFEAAWKRSKAEKLRRQFEGFLLFGAAIASIAILFITGLKSIEHGGWRYAILGTLPAIIVFPCLVSLIQFHSDHGDFSIPFSTYHPCSRLVRIEYGLRAINLGTFLTVLIGTVYVSVAAFGIESSGWGIFAGLVFVLLPVLKVLNEASVALEGFLAKQVLWYLDRVVRDAQARHASLGADAIRNMWENDISEKFAGYLTSWTMDEATEHVTIHAHFRQPSTLGISRDEVTLLFYYDPKAGIWTSR